MNKPLYSTAQIREAERIAISVYGLSEETLMLRAAAAAMDFVLENYAQKKRIVICCGQGNNGGDGVTLAGLLQKTGRSVCVLYAAEKPAAATTLKQDVQCEPFTMEKLTSADLVIDALLGIGLHSAVQSPYLDIIHAINALNKPVIALDLPSGLSADTGAVLGGAVKATGTITFIGYKPGLFTGAGLEYAGKVILADLDLPETILAQGTPVAALMDGQSIAPLPRRSRDAHKGQFGRVLVIGGNYGLGGAGLLAAQGAYRTGAGLVTLATRQEHLTAMLSIMPEVMACGIEKAEDLDRFLTRATVIIIGPGLGYDHWAQTLFQAVLNANKPCIIDADGLNLLAASPAILKAVRAPVILTPHPGEAARLLGIKTAAVQADRLRALSVLVQRYQATVVLKGAGTLIGSCNASTKTLCPVGNPGMASGGMGDLLSGIIGALLAQGLSPETAACLGVCIHGQAGDLAAKAGERGMVASDLLIPLRQLIN